MLAEHRVPLLQIDAVDDVVDEEGRFSRIVSLDRLDGGVALRAPWRAAVGALLGEVEHEEILALGADREAAPELGPARLAPADAQLLGRVIARRALVGDDRAHQLSP